MVLETFVLKMAQAKARITRQSRPDSLTGSLMGVRRQRRRQGAGWFLMSEVPLYSILALESKELTSRGGTHPLPRDVSESESAREKRGKTERDVPGVCVSLCPRRVCV